MTMITGDDDVFQTFWKVFQTKLLLDDLYGRGYRALAARARRDLLNEGPNVSGGGMRAEL